MLLLWVYLLQPSSLLKAIDHVDSGRMSAKAKKKKKEKKKQKLGLLDHEEGSSCGVMRWRELITFWNWIHSDLNQIGYLFTDLLKTRTGIRLLLLALTIDKWLISVFSKVIFGWSSGSLSTEDIEYEQSVDGTLHEWMWHVFFFFFFLI